MDERNAYYTILTACYILINIMCQLNYNGANLRQYIVFQLAFRYEDQ